MGKHMAVITGRELHRLLVELGVDVRDRNGKPPVALLPDGREIVLPADDRKAGTPERTLSAIAASLGTDKADLLAALGRERVAGGKPATHMQRATAPGGSKNEALAVLRNLRARVNEIEQWLGRGTHDADLYRRAYLDGARAYAELQGSCPPDGDGVAGFSPDDRGFRPSSPDAVTTGAGRATGLAATAAKRGRTFTRWEYDEKTGAQQ